MVGNNTARHIKSIEWLKKIEKGQITTNHQLDPPLKEKRNVGRNYPKDLLILANYAGDKWNKNSNKAIVVKKIIIAFRF